MHILRELDRSIPKANVIEVLSADDIAQTLSQMLPQQIRVEFTDNARSMISLQRQPTFHRLRLHHMFRLADNGVIKAIAETLNGHATDDTQEALHIFIRAHRDKIRKLEPRRIAIRTRGAFHDLAEIFDQVQLDYFDQAIHAEITWGKRIPLSKHRRSIRLGSFSPQERIIRIHPALDQAWVPRFYIESVVYHEMLHVVVPPEERGEKLIYHTNEFRRREALFNRHLEVLAWEDANIPRLLSSNKRSRRTR